MFESFFGKSFNPEKDIPSLSGKVILVTGGAKTGNTGLGKETVLQLAKHDPKEIVLAARTQSKAEAAIAEITTIVPGANISFLELDLASLASVKKAADEFTSRSDRLDILINNAGVMMLPWSRTQDDYEIQFGTNHMGHALLTKLLLPTLLQTAQHAGADVRIVTLSSEGHKLFSGPEMIYEQSALEKFHTTSRYGHSKLANIYHARELARRYPSLTAISLHPGVIVTDLYSTYSANNLVIKAFTVGGKLATAAGLLYDVPAGTKNQLWAATAPRDEVRAKGYYLLPVGKGVADSWSKMGGNAKKAEELWDWTEAELKKHGY
ncbi:NAD(P)-binding protein [Acrodontium crateriforme]|uniref:NAD(P)-binding protein n=1 Tax=Acrodontium crateriforme TaxID=150365 RepID=A0AAQ3R729_9PEZI|nr:NAD(P)-binding protein [Acrodontium crateriforme]